jgi:hypothetical protein
MVKGLICRRAFLAKPVPMGRTSLSMKNPSITNLNRDVLGVMKSVSRTISWRSTGWHSRGNLQNYSRICSHPFRIRPSNSILGINFFKASGKMLRLCQGMA